MQVKVKTLKEGLKAPQYKTDGASGFDFEACLSEDVVLMPCRSVLIPTGLVFEIPFGYELQVRSRSGLALDSGVIVLNSPGTVDSDYRGEVKVILFNSSDKSLTIRNGDRIAQGVICKVERCEFRISDELSHTQRQSAGFGSTKIRG